MAYADCASESHKEKAFCEYMENELKHMGIPFERQMLGNEVVTDGWNILARVPGERGKKRNRFLEAAHTGGMRRERMTSGTAGAEDGRLFSEEALGQP